MLTGIAPDLCGLTWYTVIFVACAGSMDGGAARLSESRCHMRADEVAWTDADEKKFVGGAP